MYILTLRESRRRRIRRHQDEFDRLCTLIEQNRATHSDQHRAALLNSLLHVLDRMPAATIEFETFELAAATARRQGEPLDNITEHEASLFRRPGRKAIGKPQPRWPRPQAAQQPTVS